MVKTRMLPTSFSERRWSAATSWVSSRRDWLSSPSVSTTTALIREVHAIDRLRRREPRVAGAVAVTSGQPGRDLPRKPAGEGRRGTRLGTRYPRRVQDDQRIVEIERPFGRVDRDERQRALRLRP